MCTSNDFHDFWSDTSYTPSHSLTGNPDTFFAIIPSVLFSMIRIDNFEFPRYGVKNVIGADYCPEIFLFKYTEPVPVAAPLKTHTGIRKYL
jgi:hypothetical protein